MVGKANLKWRATMLAKYKTEAALTAHMKAIASKGGTNGTGYGFAHGTVDPHIAGAKGGAVSRKPKKGVDS